MESKKRYCYQHNIQFDSERLYVEHQTKCSELLNCANVCTQYIVDGAMCGKFFNHTKDLCMHASEEHGVFLCDVCDYQTIDQSKLSAHHHKKTHKTNIHTSKSCFSIVFAADQLIC